MRSRTIQRTMVAVAMILASAPAMTRAQVITNGTQQGLPHGWPGFLFELEFPLHSLKEVPTWNEIEQLLDDPYAICAVGSPGCSCATHPNATNDQGYAAYCSTILRRTSPGVALPPLLVHPLDYHPQTGEQMRLLDPSYPGGEWQVPSELVETSPGVWEWQYETLLISSGADRGMTESAIDYNSPHLVGSNPAFAGGGLLTRYETHPSTLATPACIATAEAVPPEGSIVCGTDPGEPPGYSVAALVDVNPSPVLQTLRLVDPAGCAARNAESPGSCTGGGEIVRLRKPSVRATPKGQPDYLQNVDAAAVTASNENDYVRGSTFAERQQGRREAMRLGKALFWDMQVGSDSVQSCASCHFHAGADSRTKNQLNPNHIGGDTIFDIKQPNQDLVASDFPFVKLANPEVSGDQKCTTPIVATVNGGVLENTPDPATGAVGTAAAGVTMTVCDAANRVNGRADGSPHNDVASSMGVKFGLFKDIPAPGPGAFGPPTTGVASLLPDLRWIAGEPGAPVGPDGLPIDANLDPIEGFRGADASGHGLRRVEPRNTPTFIMTAMNFDNFWDGRARHDFNGGSVFGASDPFLHVFVDDGTGALTPTRQIVRNASIASLATGPALSDFEMSRAGRNWAKIGKKLLQRGVTPLANQLVSTTDGLLGVYSNQGGVCCSGSGATECRARQGAPVGVADRSGDGTTAPGKPGLCISYPALIRRAFNQQLWQSTTSHVAGCYTDNPDPLAPPPNAPACAAGTEHDPFDGYVLTPDDGVAARADTNQFTQMEANMSLFFGMSVHLWDTILMPDDTPFDRFHDANPFAHELVGEAGEPGLVASRPLCSQNGNVQPCITEVGNFKRDVALGGTRQAGAPDPLLGMDIFSGSNLSGKNPNFRTGRCAECHLGPMLTDHNIITTPAGMLPDFAAEFVTPGVEATIEPIGKPRVISGLLLEAEFEENGQDGIERRIINQSIVPNPADGLAYPDGIFNADRLGSGSAFFDNGIYNLGVTPCEADQVDVIGRCDDVGRGGPDAFGWPLSLSALMLKNLGGVDQEPGITLPTFVPPPAECAGLTPEELAADVECATGGLFEESAQDQQINPGFEGDDILNPLLPAHLAPFANAVNVGEAAPEADEVAGGLNTITNVPILEGFIDTLGPFDPSGLVNEAMNMSEQPLMGTCAAVTGDAVDADGDGCADGVVNRVGRMGSFKAPSIRQVELTGPYFHNGGKLTLRQVIDFYTRGGDHPITNAEHRDFNLVNMNIEVQSNLTEEEKVALVDFLLELTDDRVRYEREPFDHPDLFVPLDGTAPENDFGRAGFDTTTAVCSYPASAGPAAGTPIPGATGPCFRHVPAAGAAGGAATPTFLNLTNERLVGPAAFCGDSAHSQYCR